MQVGFNGYKATYLLNSRPFGSLTVSYCGYIKALLCFLLIHSILARKSDVVCNGLGLVLNSLVISSFCTFKKSPFSTMLLISIFETSLATLSIALFTKSDKYISLPKLVNIGVLSISHDLYLLSLPLNIFLI